MEEFPRGIGDRVPIAISRSNKRGTLRAARCLLLRMRRVVRHGARGRCVVSRFSTRKVSQKVFKGQHCHVVHPETSSLENYL